MPSKEKKKDKRSKLMRKLGRSRNENPLSQSQRAPGLVGLLETMRVQMEVFSSHLLFKWRHYYSISSPFTSPFMACLLTWEWCLNYSDSRLPLGLLTHEKSKFM